MVLQNSSLSVAKALRDPLAFLSVEHNATKLRVNRVVLIETQAVLRDHIELSPKH